MTAARGGPVAAAVLFDMDGLLVDSEPLWTIAEEELADSLGGEWSAEIKARVAGARLDHAVPEILRYYAVDPTPARVAEASDFLLARMVGLFRDDLPIYEGARELVDAVRDAGARTALVSSSFRVLVDAALERLGRDRFDLTISGDEVGHGKPHPEPYLTACARLGVAPAAAVVVEDALNGVLSAEAAGCRVVVVPSVAPVEPAPGRVVVGSLGEVLALGLLGVTAPPAGASAS